MLMRAPSECGSWFWDLDDVTAPGLEAALETAARMSAVLRTHELLEPAAVEWNWFEVGTGGLGIHSRLDLAGRGLDDASVAGQVKACRPAGYPAAEMSSFLVVGSGVWIDADGNPHREPRLVELTVSPDPVSSWAELSVHHDVWARCDFRGRPHPSVHDRNAPRLAAALRDLDTLLGVPGEPGEPTYFGKAEGHGLKAPEMIDGLGPDLTDLL
ncbi:hypothetical protein EIZ62_15380 [Streptomyces ficellus]|uniref:Uncharacterized protein n=2 Tax=Streptomyces ficellus TaxID=1977088 RepID=A0A6I6FX38_9ACTN|nr:hypothetical protein [Streptomyces ficellus]QGV82678.1 hypothetical protein EIZ62_15380 [Streptomyces ficellus]